MTAIKNSPVERQTDIIAQLRRDVDTLQQAAKVNQLNYSALHNTALPVYGLNNDGVTELKSRIGKQPDGNYAIQYMNGSAPPMPSNIGVAERQLGILITWDGSFVNNTEKPSNFSRLDVYIDDESGFTTSVDNLMGSMFTESALFIGADVSIHYVRIVAVNTSDVPSSMTAEVAVTPLPAGQLAAGSVDAINLVAELILTTSIVIGDVDGGRLVFSPEEGLELYMPDGTTRSVHMDHTTGNLLAIGTYKTAPNGSRMEWNPGGNNPDKARFFPADGDQYAELTTESVNIGGTEYALMYFTASSPLVTGETGFVYAYPHAAGISWQAVGEPTFSTVEAHGFYARAKGPSAYLESDHSHVADGNGHRVALAHIDASGNVYPNAILEYRLNASNVGYLRSPNKDSAIVFEALGIHARNAADNAHIPMYASAFTVLSSIDSKSNVEPLPFDSGVVIRNAPSKMWERPGSNTKYVGPMAEDLPPQIQRDMNGVMGVDVGSLVGILWDQVGKLTKKVDELSKSKLVKAEVG